MMSLVTGLKSFDMTEDTDEIFSAEALHPTNIRSRGAEMTVEKCADSWKLLERGTFKVILKEEIRENAKIFTRMIFLALKSTV